MTTKIELKPGVLYFPGLLDRNAQVALRDEIYAAINAAELFQSTMPRWGNPMSVKMLNLGALGWVLVPVLQRVNGAAPVRTTNHGEHVVAELGGSTSHLASLARERGIPMVLGVLDATSRIPDGSQVAVDGVAGVVRWMT